MQKEAATEKEQTIEQVRDQFLLRQISADTYSRLLAKLRQKNGK